MTPEFLDAAPRSSATPVRSSLPPGLRAGTRIGSKYELLRKIGSGAMGEVWAARHLSLQGDVAIKLVTRDVAHDDGSSSEGRFLFEARVAAQLSRKTRHIVSVTDHGQHGPYAYLVMELLEGESLEERLDRHGPMPLAKVVPLVHQIARALAVAHADGIVHRDLKPSNVFVTADEDRKALIKILDFGVAQLRRPMHRAPVDGRLAKESTLPGFLLGTPAYMSPEQALAKAIDHRADVWALAVTAYHLLADALPFDGETPEEIFARLCRLEATPIALHRPDLPLSAMSDLFARAFAQEIDQRFPSATAFANALEQVARLEAGMRGAPPLSMGTISLPPPARTPGEGSSESVERGSEPLPSEGSIVAAGVPRRRPWPRIVAGAIAIGMLLAIGFGLSVRFQREARDASGKIEPSSLPASAADDRGAAIPPPEPGAATPTARLEDLPSVTPTVPARARTVTPTPPQPPSAPSAASTLRAAAAAAPPEAFRPKPGDKSEVF